MTTTTVTCTAQRNADNWWQGVAHIHHRCTVPAMPHPTHPHHCVCGVVWPGVGEARCSTCDTPRNILDLRIPIDGKSDPRYVCLDSTQCHPTTPLTCTNADTHPGGEGKDGMSVLADGPASVRFSLCDSGSSGEDRADALSFAEFADLLDPDGSIRDALTVQPGPPADERPLVFRYRYRLLGGHVHVRHFAGRNPDALGLGGTVVYRLDEWEAFRELQEQGAIYFQTKTEPRVEFVDDGAGDG